MQEQMRLYKENRVNPMAGCLPMLIQLPIWIGLYQALFFSLKTRISQADFSGFRTSPSRKASHTYWQSCRGHRSSSYSG